MNLTRLVVLGLLAERGPQHGHQLRREVRITKADEWAGVGAGSLNRELRALSDAALVETVRTERVDNRPERTVHRITDSGRVELDRLREQAIGSLSRSSDPVAAGLIFAGAVGPDVLAHLMARHRRAVEAELDRLAAERARGEAEGYLRPDVSPLQAAAFRRSEVHARAELAWHDEWDRALAAR
jgi:DNA-binding PadR family transcriptional regulator